MATEPCERCRLPVATVAPDSRPPERAKGAHKILGSLLAQTAGLATFTQIIFCLPLALDWLGPPSFLLLSLLLVLHAFSYSTLRLMLKNTPLASLIGLLNAINPMVPVATALLVIWLYLNPVGQDDAVWGLKRLLAETLPALYAATLRIISPVFSILEGFATLLVAQVLGRMTRAFIDEGTDELSTEEGFEWRRMGSLVLASLLYCSGGVWLYKAHPFSSPFSNSSLPPILLGAALASVFFLTMIAFSRRRATVIETALVFLYVVYGGWMSGMDESMQSQSFPSGWLSTGWGKAKSLPASLTGMLPFPTTSGSTLASPVTSFLVFVVHIMGSVFGINMGLLSGVGKSDKDVLEAWGGAKDLDAVGLAMNIFRTSTGTLWKIASSLPPTLLISLCFRLLVLFMAARIIPVIRRAAAGWEDDLVGDAKSGFWDGRKLAEEPASARVATILLSYRRMILIAVYTHLLLLDNGSQLWWRWVNIFVTLSVWAMELMLEDDFDDDGESIKSWRVD